MGVILDASKIITVIPGKIEMYNYYSRRRKNLSWKYFYLQFLAMEYSIKSHGEEISLPVLGFFETTNWYFFVSWPPFFPNYRHPYTSHVFSFFTPILFSRPPNLFVPILACNLFSRPQTFFLHFYPPISFFPSFLSSRAIFRPILPDSTCFSKILSLPNRFSRPLQPFCPIWLP